MCGKVVNVPVIIYKNITHTKKRYPTSLHSFIEMEIHIHKGFYVQKTVNS